MASNDECLPLSDAGREGTCVHNDCGERFGVVRYIASPCDDPQSFMEVLLEGARVQLPHQRLVVGYRFVHDECNHCCCDDGSYDAHEWIPWNRRRAGD